ncbi:hypothetical protein [Amycolatopsis granulosa]|uniref:hypothetical protein n=1 Tax=Amycolatopsis granulosa TaxID=185684 RepID=UPI0014213129|nr:hypothetical protein [Amycolatopsis granulosa]NIH88151.1 hypothetical protein [Amycolatopsis granulosa]
MRWRVTTCGLGLVLLLAAACGGQTGTGGPPGGGATSTVPAAPSAPATRVPPALPGGPREMQPPAGVTPVPAGRVDASALPADFPREVYVSADGRQLFVRAEEGGCGRAAAELTAQDTQRVVVTLVESRSNLAGQMCTMDLRYPVVTVTLSAPLNERIVVLKSATRGY